MTENKKQLDNIIEAEKKSFHKDTFKQILAEWGSGVEGKHVCEFCDSTETTKYPAEGKGDVYLCEECRSIGSGESADL